MKIIFQNKVRFYILVISFLLLQGFLKTYISNGLLMEFLLPLFFFVVTILYSYYSREGSWKNTVEISIFYMIIGYFLLYDNMSSYRIVLFMLGGFLGNLVSSLSFDLNKEKVKEYKESEKRIFSYITPLFFVLILELFYELVTFGKITFTFHVLPLLMLLLIIYIFYLFISSFVKNSFHANVVFAGIFLLLFIVNQMRIYYTSDIFLLYDVMFLEAAGEMANFVDVTLVNALNYIFWPLLIVGAFVYS